MKRLTIKERNEKCLDLWKWCARTGKDKWDYPRFGTDFPEYFCYLCEYGVQRYAKKYNCDRDSVGLHEEACTYCPLVENRKYAAPYTGCLSDRFSYDKWEKADTKQDRKKYAKAFYNELKEILK